MIYTPGRSLWLLDGKQIIRARDQARIKLGDAEH
jgi:hypothetical protein